MSLVLGYIDNDGNMYMAGDSRGSTDSEHSAYMNRKVFPFKGHSLVGMIGSYKMINFVSSTKTKGNDGYKLFDNIKNMRQDILGKVIPNMIDIAGEEVLANSTGMIMFPGNSNKGRIVVVQGDGSCLEVSPTVIEGRSLKFDAVGGKSFAAEAVMDALLKNDKSLEKSPKKLLLTTLEAIASRSGTIGGPYYIIESLADRRNKNEKPVVTRHEDTKDIVGVRMSGGA